MHEVHAVIVRWRGGGQVGAIRAHTLAVGLGGVLVTADALHDVRRHVLEVPGRGHHPRSRSAAASALPGVGEASITCM